MHIPKRFTGEKQVQTTAVLDVLLASEEDPTRARTRGQQSAGTRTAAANTHQLSARMTCFAECTRHGSAYVGEFKILRANSFVEAMTMNLANRVQYPLFPISRESRLTC